MSLSILKTVLEDLKVPASDQAEIMAIIQHQPGKRRKLISRGETLALLGISAPTLRQYIRRGLVHEFRLSARKIRFDADEIERLACGMVQISTVTKPGEEVMPAK